MRLKPLIHLSCFTTLRLEFGEAADYSKKSKLLAENMDGYWAFWRFEVSLGPRIREDDDDLKAIFFNPMQPYR